MNRILSISEIQLHSKKIYDLATFSLLIYILNSISNNFDRIYGIAEAKKKKLPQNLSFEKQRSASQIYIYRE